MAIRSMGGTDYQAGKMTLASEALGREAARWQAAVNELNERGLISDLNGKGQVFEVTHQGFLLADELKDQPG